MIQVDADGRVQPAPALQSYAFQLPTGIAAGPDGGLWVTDNRTGLVVEVPSLPSVPPAAAGGAPLEPEAGEAAADAAPAP